MANKMYFVRNKCVSVSAKPTAAISGGSIISNHMVKESKMLAASKAKAVEHKSVVKIQPFRRPITLKL